MWSGSWKAGDECVFFEEIMARRGKRDGDGRKSYGIYFVRFKLFREEFDCITSEGARETVSGFRDEGR